MLVVAVLAVQLAKTQTVTIKDKITHQPLELVTLYSKTPEATAITDAKGHADITAFKGADSIKVRLIGYEDCIASYDSLNQFGFSIYLEEADLSLNTVVVSATKWEQQKRNVPNKITSIKPKEVVIQMPQTAADMLGTTGEVYIQKSQMGGGSPMIRGFAANRVLITVDGVRMNNAIFRSGNLQNVISLDPLATEEAEVIFGPGSVIYGSDAIGGVMDFHTISPKLSLTDKTLIKGSAALRMASANFEKTGHFDINIGGKKFAWVTSATYTDFDDLRMGSIGPDEYLRPEYVTQINGQDTVVPNPDSLLQVPTGYSQVNVMQKLRFSPNEKWNFVYSFHYSTTTDYPRYDRLIEYRNGTLRDGDWYYGPQEWMMNSLSIENKADCKMYDNARLLIAYQNFEESRHNRGFGKSVLDHRTENVDVISANLDFSKTSNEKHHVFYGLEALLNNIGSVAEGENVNTGETEAISTRYPDGSTWNSFAAYASYRYLAGKKVTVQLGVRYNYVMTQATFDTSFFPFPFTDASLNTGALTGSAGIVYRPSPTWQINLNASTGFRAPNMDDIGKVFDSEPGSVVVPNPDLESEYAYNGELGIVKTIANRVKVDVTGFYTILQNAMVRRNYQLNGQDSIVYDGELSQVQAIQNAASATVYGVQAGLEIKLPAGFGIASRFSYQKGEEELEDGTISPLRHAAPWFGITHVTYKRERLLLDFYGVYNGEIAFEDLAVEEQGKPHLYAIDENGNPHSPGWYTLNFKVSYHVTDYLQLVAGVENILDHRYRPYSSGIVAAGRNILGTVRMTF